MATGNQGKLREYRDLLEPAGFEVVPFEPGIEETGSTYLENAALKAEAAMAATGTPAVGDDSGVEVEALDGFPGLYSARLGKTQPERTAELLRRLEHYARPWRARFTCTIALVRPGETTRSVTGERRGEIVPEWRGGVGFGYDPVFYVAEAGKTFGEMDPEEKHRWSHRGAAVRALLASGWLS